MIIFHLAYLDPGTGSVVIQALLGGFLGAAYVGRKYFARVLTGIKSVVSSRQGNKPDGES